MKKAIIISLGCTLVAAVTCNLILSCMHYKDIFEEEIELL